MKKGAIFDLDGTLVSTIGLHEAAWKETFLKYGVELTQDELKEQSGKKNTLFIAIILERRGITTGIDALKLSNEKDEAVIAALEANPPKVFSGVHELLKLLKEKNIKIALATSATHRTALLLGKELLPYFDAAIFAEDIERGKPDPDMFLKAASKIGLASEDCIVFEDAKSGVEAAHAGKFMCIARDNHLGQDLSKADIVVEEYNPAELVSYFI